MKRTNPSKLRIEILVDKKSKKVQFITIHSGRKPTAFYVEHLINARDVLNERILKFLTTTK